MLPGQRHSTGRTIQTGFLSNISISWKMGLMVLALFLGIAGITTSAYIGLQSLRYQLSNIYDFMLIPIVAINHADTALADSQFHIVQLYLSETTANETDKGLADIRSNIQTAENTITQYDTEWVTTVSPEFTKTLRQAGKLALQQEEVAVLAEFHISFDAYKINNEKYLATVRAGQADPELAHETIESLEIARSNLQRLININNEYADFSNELAEAAFRQALFSGGVVLVISLMLGLLMSYLLATSITRRLGELTRGALGMQEGNLEQAVAVGGRDEVGILGTAFNDMAKQLKELLDTLEQRVADRTRALATVAEVGTVASTILETNRLLQEVVDLTKERFNLYHSHIYLLDETGGNLVLASGAGQPGRQMVAKGHSIPLDLEQSVVARAARERKGVTVNDVTTVPDFLPNPLLPDTRSELAVPMLVGGNVIGVFDVQSIQVGRFTDADISVQTTLAAQVATSIQNVRSFEQSKAKADLETLVNTIGQKIQQTTSVQDTLQIAIREISLALGAPRVQVSIERGKDSGIGTRLN
jgi:putative methionine-R-sulfoxide reductase with GAF domain